MSSSQGQASGGGRVVAEERSPDRHQHRLQLHHQQLGQSPDPAGQALRHRQLQLRGGQRGSAENVSRCAGDRLQ